TNSASTLSGRTKEPTKSSPNWICWSPSKPSSAATPAGSHDCRPGKAQCLQTVGAEAAAVASSPVRRCERIENPPLPGPLLLRNEEREKTRSSIFSQLLRNDGGARHLCRFAVRSFQAGQHVRCLELLGAPKRHKCRA